MADSSTETADAQTAAVATTTTTTQDVNPAESSAADQGVKSALDAVNSALGEKKTESSPASTEQGSKEPDPNSTPKDDEALLQEEAKRFSEAAQHRIRELVGQRKAVTAEVETVRREVETLKPQAEAHQALTGYMQQHAISGKHLENALAITAMINAGDFATALPIIQNLYQTVLSGAGETLPADLHKQVELGYLTEAHAKELHKTRLTAKRTQERAEKQSADITAERQQREVDTMVTTATTAADKWSAEQTASNPDWNQMRDLVTKEMKLRLLELGPAGYPRTEKAVRKLLDEVKKDVEGTIGRFRPAPKPIANQVTGGSASPRSAAKPKTTLDALEMGLANAKSG